MNGTKVNNTKSRDMDPKEREITEQAEVEKVKRRIDLTQNYMKHLFIYK